MKIKKRAGFFLFSSYLAVERGHPVRTSPDNLSVACPRADVIFLRDWAECDGGQAARMVWKSGYGL